MPSMFHFVLHNNHTEICVLKNICQSREINATSFYTFTFIRFHYFYKYKNR